MRHGKAGYKLGRTSTHRTSTLRNLAAGVFEHGRTGETVIEDDVGLLQSPHGFQRQKLRVSRA